MIKDYHKGSISVLWYYLCMTQKSEGGGVAAFQNFGRAKQGTLPDDTSHYILLMCIFRAVLYIMNVVVDQVFFVVYVKSFHQGI